MFLFSTWAVHRGSALAMNTVLFGPASTATCFQFLMVPTSPLKLSQTEKVLELKKNPEGLVVLGLIQPRTTLLQQTFGHDPSPS